MSDDESVAVERRSPKDVFGLLSNDLRVEILQALGTSGEPRRFSELREAVGERDSGKFNYHLGKLVGNLVVHDEDGYRLSIAGRKMYGAMISGAYTTEAEIAPFEFGEPCPMCGHDSLVAEYGDEKAQMYCPECENWHNEFSFPPGSLDQFERHELPRAFDRWMQAAVSKVVLGFCGNCGGRVDSYLEPADEYEDVMPVRARYVCERCSDEVRSYPALPLMFHPKTVSFFDDHGVNVLSDPSWTYFQGEQALDITIASEDPLRARVRFELDGDVLEAIIGPDVDIESVTVTPAADS